VHWISESFVPGCIIRSRICLDPRASYLNPPFCSAEVVERTNLSSAIAGAVREYQA
jgi:hypothetical protein